MPTSLFRHRLLLAAAALAAGLATPLAAQAAGPQVKTQAPGFYRLMVGEIEVTALSDARWPCRWASCCRASAPR